MSKPKKGVGWLSRHPCLLHSTQNQEQSNVNNVVNVAKLDDKSNFVKQANDCLAVGTGFYLFLYRYIAKEAGALDSAGDNLRMIQDCTLF